MVDLGLGKCCTALIPHLPSQGGASAKPKAKAAASGDSTTIKILQFLVPLLVLALAVGARFLTAPASQ